jgi:hypothetical protein
VSESKQIASYQMYYWHAHNLTHYHILANHCTLIDWRVERSVLFRHKCEDWKIRGLLLLHGHRSRSVHVFKRSGECLHEASKLYCVSLILCILNTRNGLFLAIIGYFQIDVGVVSCGVNWPSV